MHGFKTCFKCLSVLPTDMFYKHKGMADGHLNKCKECSKKDVSERRLLHIEYVRSYDRKRKNKKERNLANASRTKKRRNEDKRYCRAHNAVARAIKKGILVRGCCEICGNDEHVHAHHDDYDLPLDVRWLCPPCHRHRHNELAKINKDVF